MPRKLRVLVVIRSVRHWTYVESVVAALIRRGHVVILRFDRTASVVKSLTTPEPKSLRLHGFLDGFGPLDVDWMRRRGRSRSIVNTVRELRSYASYVRRLGPRDFYTRRWARYLPPRVRRLATSRGGRSLLRQPIADRLFGTIEAAVPPAPAVIADIRRIAPDVVVACPANMRFDEEIEYVKAARKLKLPSVVQAYSWDNLTTKGRFHVLPDRLLVWDDLHERAAREIHHVPPERIVRTGAPFFDKWLDVPEVEPRDAFLRRVGIDNAFVLYVGSSKSIARDETTVVEGIRAALAASEDESLRNAWIVVRPHPANADSWRKLNVDHSVVWPAEAKLPESDEDIGMFASSVRHALAVVGVNTSAMIDAVALDAPTAAILVDAFEGTQAGTEHFRALADAGAIAVVASAFELTGYLGRLKSGEDPTRDGRQAFLRTHLRSATASAGEAGADEIEAIATGRGM